jgi:hypothetical protein
MAVVACLAMADGEDLVETPFGLSVWPPGWMTGLAPVRRRVRLIKKQALRYQKLS